MMTELNITPPAVNEMDLGCDEGDLEYQDESDMLSDEQLYLILRDYQKKRLLETMIGPGISLVIHVCIIILMAIFIVTSPKPKEPQLVVETIVIEEVDIEEEILVEIEEIEEEIIEDEMPDVSEKMFSELNTPDPVVHDVSDDVPQTDDSMDTEEVLDVMVNASPLRTSMLGGRLNAGRGKGGKSGSGKGNQGLIEDGLRWLASQQRSDGRWNYDKHINAVSSAAALAFLGHGHSTLHGKYKHVVQKYVDFYCKHQRADGSYGNHGHATPFVAMAMSDALAMDPSNSKLRQFCERMLDYAIKTQHVDGGWSGGARSTSKTTKEIDVGATGWWAMALFSYRLAGMQVPQENIDKVKTVLRQVANGSYDGKIITTSHGGLENSFNPDYTTGAYIATILQFMGCPRNDPVVERFSSQTLGQIPTSGTRNYWVMYNLGMGLFQLGKKDSRWRNFEKAMRIEMSSRKVTTAEGTYWENASAFGAPKAKGGKEMETSGSPQHWGRVGSTAMAILNLEVTHRYGDVYEYNSTTINASGGGGIEFLGGSDGIIIEIE